MKVLPKILFVQLLISSSLSYSAPNNQIETPSAANKNQLILKCTHNGYRSKIDVSVLKNPSRDLSAGPPLVKVDYESTNSSRQQKATWTFSETYLNYASQLNYDDLGMISLDWKEDEHKSYVKNWGRFLFEYHQKHGYHEPAFNVISGAIRYETTNKMRDLMTLVGPNAVGHYFLILHSGQNLSVFSSSLDFEKFVPGNFSSYYEKKDYYQLNIFSDLPGVELDCDNGGFESETWKNFSANHKQFVRQEEDRKSRESNRSRDLQRERELDMEDAYREHPDDCDCGDPSYTDPSSWAAPPSPQS